MALAVVEVAEIAWAASVLAGSDDRLLLASANDDTLDAATRDRVEQTDESLGRTVHVETVAPP